jgi:hypothetical protein
VKGWMCMKPSPWVCTPTRTFALSAEVSNSGGGVSHSPQTFAATAACQWSPASPVDGFPGWGGTSAVLDRETTTSATPITTTSATAP